MTKIGHPDSADGIKEFGAVLENQPRAKGSFHLQSQRVQCGGSQALERKGCCCRTDASMIRGRDELKSRRETSNEDSRVRDAMKE